MMYQWNAAATLTAAIALTRAAVPSCRPNLESVHIKFLSSVLAWTFVELLISENCRDRHLGQNLLPCAHITHSTEYHRYNFLGPDGLVPRAHRTRSRSVCRIPWPFDYGFRHGPIVGDARGTWQCL